MPDRVHGTHSWTACTSECVYRMHVDIVVLHWENKEKFGDACILQDASATHHRSREHGGPFVGARGCLRRGVEEDRGATRCPLHQESRKEHQQRDWEESDHPPLLQRCCANPLNPQSNIEGTLLRSISYYFLMLPSDALLEILARVILPDDAVESQLLRFIAVHLHKDHAPSFQCSTSQIGGALNNLPLFSKWKKQTGRTLLQLLAANTNGMLAVVDVGKEKGVNLNPQFNALALSALYEASEVAWRPSRQPSSWAKCELARAIIHHVWCHPSSVVPFR